MDGFSHRGIYTHELMGELLTVFLSATVAEVHCCLLCVLEAPGQAPHPRFVTSPIWLNDIKKLTKPGWVDAVKTSCSNELPPQDADWYAITVTAMKHSDKPSNI